MDNARRRLNVISGSRMYWCCGLQPKGISKRWRIFTKRESSRLNGLLGATACAVATTATTHTLQMQLECRRSGISNFWSRPKDSGLNYIISLECERPRWQGNNKNGNLAWRRMCDALALETNGIDGAMLIAPESTFCHWHVISSSYSFPFAIRWWRNISL